MINERTYFAGLDIDGGFREFIELELLPAIEVPADRFWQGLARIATDLKERNRELLATRDELQSRIDEFHRQTAGKPDHEAYVNFLREIGYVVPVGPAFRIQTRGVDPEIATTAGPQLVVPVSNARFALNAANSRWVSLYDSLYGSDVIDENDGKGSGRRYNPVRGAAVIAFAARFLDDALPLLAGSHTEIGEYRVRRDGDRSELAVVLRDGTVSGLADPSQYVGHDDKGTHTVLLFVNHGLHVEIHIDAEDPVGRDAAGHVSDIVLESALTTIQDFEDSVAAVDAEDKTQVYRNWFGLMEGTLEAGFHKYGRKFERRLAGDRSYVRADGASLTLPGRSLMLVRNVGHLMQTDTVIDADGDEIFEGILDAVVSVACALNDIRGTNRFRNSRTGSVYIVKPKLHGPDEVAFTDMLMSRVEDLLGLDRYTVKIGVMDEERRTTVNLEECIRAVRHRLVFINTGFLDRTGDEIHTSMSAGPVRRKEAIKQEPWIRAYEDRNVDIGIRCGLPGKAQIGKGMWPKTEAMREMVENKHEQLEAGASCAWVPSPTAAALHAMHYHQVDVCECQRRISERGSASLDDILAPPLGNPSYLTHAEVEMELKNNAQSILGYVVRWIDSGVGCSKVPDINGVNLMEDRATLRISSQHIANWLKHGLCTADQVRGIFKHVAAIVDAQNHRNPGYEPMTKDLDASISFHAACALVNEAEHQPNGYTEPVLHRYRRRRKSQGPP